MRIRIEHDQDCEKPEISCEVSYASRSRYVLGTKPGDSEEHERLKREIDHGSLIGLPVKAYVHSGQVMTADPVIGARWPFDCTWDAGCSGYAYMTREKAKEVLGVKRITLKQIAKIHEVIIQDVATLSEWLDGQCYGYVIEDDEGQELDSCWGFVGYKFCEEEANRAMKHLEKAKVG